MSEQDSHLVGDITTVFFSPLHSKHNDSVVEQYLSTSTSYHGDNKCAINATTHFTVLTFMSIIKLDKLKSNGRSKVNNKISEES